MFQCCYYEKIFVLNICYKDNIDIINLFFKVKVKGRNIDGFIVWIMVFVEIWVVECISNRDFFFWV